jgi:hypothetical protein
MNEETRDPGAEETAAGKSTERRKALLTMGKYAVYAAPFTILTLTNKAKAATGHGPGKGAAKS